VTMTFDFSPGAQVPRTDVPLQAGVTAALSTGAYRDGKLAEFAAIQPGVAPAKGRLALFEPNTGEAFTRSVLARTLGAGRKPMVPSFGADPRLIVEHCLEADALREQRDKQLFWVMLLTGVLFLPGTLLWLLAFQFRAVLGRFRTARNERRESFFSGLVMALVVGLAVFFAYKPPATGMLGVYLRVVLIFPVIGWFVAHRICLRSTVRLRERWSGLLEGSGAIGATVPQAVPSSPEDKRAEELRTHLAALLSEQETNVLHYAGSKGILGMGRRWGVWQLAEELVPRPGAEEIRDFRAWDIVRRIADRLQDLQRASTPGSGIPHPMVRHWVVLPVGEGAAEIGRPAGPEMDGPRMRDYDVQQICNAQQFGRGPRHYLGTQFVLWEGQCVITLLCTVTFLHHTLRIEVTGHALGPVNGLFNAKPAAPTKKVQKTGKFWEEKEVKLPLVGTDEVVRLAVRAGLFWAPALRDWLGGTLTLPEPFGFRSAWAGPLWTHRFMADDALRVATPVLRTIHAATLEFLADQDVDLTRFENRSMALSGEVQSVKPARADVYDAD
jgi:hypothetical protein